MPTKGVLFTFSPPPSLFALPISLVKSAILFNLSLYKNFFILISTYVICLYKLIRTSLNAQLKLVLRSMTF
jgi:hypothetical protein